MSDVTHDLHTPPRELVTNCHLLSPSHESDVHYILSISGFICIIKKFKSVMLHALDPYLCHGWSPNIQNKQASSHTCLHVIGIKLV